MSNISRRSFLKMAGLTTVAVAGVSLFAGCSVASYLQVEFTQEVYDKMTADIEDADRKAEELKKIQDFMDQLNAGLKAIPLPLVDKLDKETVMDIIEEVVIRQKGEEEGRKLMDQFDIEADENGQIKSDGGFYGKILIKVTLKKDADVKVAAQCL